MPNLTLSLPEEIYSIVKRHTDIKWSEIARRAISEKAMKLAFLDKITSKSKLTLKEIEKINSKVKKGLLAKYQ